MKERRGNRPREDSSEGVRARCGSRARFRRHARRDVVFEDIGWHPYWSPQSPRSRRGGGPSLVLSCLNSHAPLQMGHRCSACELSHLVMHCKWKACPH